MGIFKSRNDQALVASAESYLTASTHTEQLNKSLYALKDIQRGRLSRGELTDRDLEYYENRLRSDIESESWTARSSATELGSKLGISDPAEIRKKALSLAPKAEQKAMAAYKPIQFVPQEVTLAAARRDRTQMDSAAKSQTLREVVGEAIGNKYARENTHKLTNDVRLLNMASDRLLGDLQQELVQRGVVPVINAQSATSNIPGRDSIPADYGLRQNLATGIGVAALTIGPVAGIAIGSHFPSQAGPVDPQALSDWGMAAGFGGIVTMIAANASRDHLKENKRTYQTMDASIREMAAKIEKEHNIPYDKEGSLSKAPTAKIEKAIEAVENIQLSTAKLILATNDGPDLPKAFGEASDVVWKAVEKGDITYEWKVTVETPAQALVTDLKEGLSSKRAAISDFAIDHGIGL